MKLAGRTAIVTGAGSGIGKAFAGRLAADGAQVVVADLRGYDEAARDIAQARGARTLGMKIDVSSQSDTERMVERTLAEFGSIDVLINNAAIFSVLALRPFEQIPVEEWMRVLQVNVLGVALCCRAVAPHMRARRRGSIINIASGAPLKGVPNFLHYIASKGAVISMTRGLARELGPDGIRVNALAPGLTLSEGVLANPHHYNTPGNATVRSRALSRDESPEDLVGAASFLASDDSAFMTGQTMVVDGGSAMI